MTGSGSDAVRELVEIFSEETPATIQQIREAIEARNGQGVAIQAMQLGRACANFGAERLQLICSSLQNAGKANDLKLAEELTGRLEEEFKVVKTTLEEFAAQQPKAEVEPT
jgi:HPt (histidine-containing phosphotransfer) domain-containing protein